MSWTSISPADVPTRLAAWLRTEPGTVRVAVDGPPCADPAEFATALIEPLRVRSRPAVHVEASSFWRDASLRLEYGREDAAALPSWLDADALRREVLDPIAAAGHYLPSLRDPRTNRSTREPVRAAEPATVLLVSGAFLLGVDLPFDRMIHFAMSDAARARRTPTDQAWTLPAHAQYDTQVRPARVADVVVKLDDPNRPAIAFRDRDTPGAS